jgi:hypothetical protein
MMLLKFRYTNWRGEDHEYVIEPRLGDRAAITHREGHWCLSGMVVTRDGDPRPDMDPTRRRTFVLVGIRDLEEVPRSQ